MTTKADARVTNLGQGITQAAGAIVTADGTKYGHVTTTKTNTFSIVANNVTNGDGWFDITDMAVTITPDNATQKVEVEVNLNVLSAIMSDVRLVRGSTPIYIGDAAGTRNRVSDSSMYITSDGNHSQRRHLQFTDSPASAAAVTYKLQGRVAESSTYIFVVNRNTNDTDNQYGARAASSISACKIK